MPLTSIKNKLAVALKQQYALPLYDTFDMYSTEGIFQAFEAQHASGMIALYGGTFNQPFSPALAAYIRTRAEAFPYSISLMLDHGASFDQCIQAIKMGFTDVMYDGSRLPLEENIANTRDVVRAAHAVGVGVEAELGHVGSGNTYQEFGARREGFTDPEDVERFVNETGVDFLAVAIGTAHGLYEGSPKLDLDLLADIRRRVEIPLVLHGGTGLNEAQYKGAIQGGIAKINVATDLFVCAARSMAEAAQQPKASFFSIGAASTTAVCERASYYLELFGARDQAGVL